PQSRSLPAARLVLLPAVAGTRIVAADFRARPDRPGLLGLLHRGRGFADHIAAFAGPLLLPVGAGRRTAERAGGLMRRLLRQAAPKFFERHQTRRAAKDVMADLGFDVHHQLVEN